MASASQKVPLTPQTEHGETEIDGPLDWKSQSLAKYYDLASVALIGERLNIEKGMEA